MKLSSSTLVGILFALWSGATPSFAAPPPTGTVDVKLRTGTFRGLAGVNGMDKFLGIPFAQQPVGALRFKAPAPITKASNKVFNATAFGNACPQPPAAFLGAPMGEDCLWMNIWRPQGLAANAKLPVLFWLHGGAFTVNSASNPQFDPTEFIQRGIDTKKTIHIRVHIASASMAPEDLNQGLLDQRQALVFVKQNIAAFGGDPTKVTIWGQSAGAGSVEAHMLYPAKESLFRAGIADSSTGPFKNNPEASVFDKPGKPFARLLQETGCASGPKAISCLQKVPFDTLLNISNTMIGETENQQLWQPAVGPPGSFVTELASAKIKRGDVLPVPYIGGTNLNEGTFFTSSVRLLGLSGQAETDAFTNYIIKLLIDNSTMPADVLNDFVEQYPANDPSAGAPFTTGDSLFDRTESFYTNEIFLSVRRFFFQHVAARQPMFAYFYKEFIPGNDISKGVIHGMELELFFGPPSLPANTSIEAGLQNQMRDFYINFVHDLNPGPQWERFNPASPRVLQLQRDNVTMIPDDWDAARVNFCNADKVMAAFDK